MCFCYGVQAESENSRHNNDMCTNYRPSSIEAFRTGALEDIRETKINPFKAELYPLELGPIIRLSVGDDVPALLWTPAKFGLVPFWAKEDQVAKLGRMAYNARAETVGEKPMFRGAWARRQYCLVPADAFYEPSWETGRAVRWRIEMSNAKPFAIAGIWERHGEGDNYFESFSMLTANADGHQVMKHFHRAGDEKRMPVIVEPRDYRAWLDATPTSARDFLQKYPADKMTARPDPVPPRAKPVRPRAKVMDDSTPQVDLF
jgi:putative SOS response-associated peptidase YedK